MIFIGTAIVRSGKQLGLRGIYFQCSSNHASQVASHIWHLCQDWLKLEPSLQGAYGNHFLGAHMIDCTQMVLVFISLSFYCMIDIFENCGPGSTRSSYSCYTV